MKLVPAFLFRAPLLPLHATESLADSPLGRRALALASPSLAGAAPSAEAAAALRRYDARARFRPTPHGLLAGVGVGRLSTRTSLSTGRPTAHLTVPWSRLAAAARALLDDPAWRRRTRLRAAPSLLLHGDHAMWLSPQGAALESILDDPDVAAILRAAAARWIRWPAPQRRRRDVDDDVILALLDDGLLVSDLVPPLVGPPPLAHFRAVAPEAAAALEPNLGTLVFRRARATLDADVVARAAALAPILSRLAQALAPPVAERDLAADVAAAAAAAAELCGPGALDLAALALGGYGVRADEPTASPPPPAPPSALLTLLIDGLHGDVLHLTAAELDALLPPAPLPETFELLLTPRRAADGWLLGLHAPAGATWGRFAHALGVAGTRLLAALARAEPPGRLDVAWAPDPDLADLCTHPPARAAALALTTWPTSRAVTPADLALTVPAPHALAGGTPSPLARVRSTLAPPGLYRLLAGYSLHRQHAPWALAWGPLAHQARLPRVVLDGFVIAPASWRLPPAGTTDLRAWRRDLRVPRFVQVGHEDELLLVDLDAPTAAADLARLPEPRPRAHEVWPPLDEALLDDDGRRVEAVVAVIADESPPAAPSRARVPTPRPAPRWRTFKLYGPPDRQDRLLAEAVAPAIAAARAARTLDAWFFLRYAEGPRHHLRVRVRGDAALRLTEHDLAAAAGDLVTVEETPYFRELARYGSDLPALERVFEADSDLALHLLTVDADPTDLAVVAVDAQARAAGLDLTARHALAERLRAAGEPVDFGPDFRARARRLHELLVHPPFPYAAKPPRARLPDLAHLLINRLGEDEPHIVYLWERALEGLRARRRRGSS